MLDRNIPFYNIILKCNNYTNTEIILPAGYSFKNYQISDEKAWAKLEYDIGDFASEDEAEKYFLSEYGQNIDDVKERCFFVADEQGQIVGSCIAWKDGRGNGEVSSLHWLVVSPFCQGQKIGKALCQRVMKAFWEKN